MFGLLKALPSSLSSPIFSSKKFPCLARFEFKHRELLAEALTINSWARSIEDYRCPKNAWKVLPLRPEPDDKVVFPDEYCKQLRALAPLAVALSQGDEGIMAFAYSILAPGASIAPHRHQRFAYTAIICLQAGSQSFLEVEHHRERFVAGRSWVFDYRLEHAVYNDCARSRIALLLLLDPKIYGPVDDAANA